MEHLVAPRIQGKEVKKDEDQDQTWTLYTPLCAQGTVAENATSSFIITVFFKLVTAIGTLILLQSMLIFF